MTSVARNKKEAFARETTGGLVSVGCLLVAVVVVAAGGGAPESVSSRRARSNSGEKRLE